jgi:hypothetical protein
VQVQAVNFLRDNLDLPVTQVEDGGHGCLRKEESVYGAWDGG